MLVTVNYQSHRMLT